ncbi:unnamed protein product, partial [Symbiodinium microadriaticum]
MFGSDTSSPPSTVTSQEPCSRLLSLKANGSQKTKRLTKLTDEEKAGIMEMTSPQDIPREERKRQYSALRRAILRSANPALTAKFSLCDDDSRFGMLKTFLVNQGVGAIEVEEKYTRFVAELRTDKYVTIFQLEKIYGKSAEAKAFIADLIKGQAGTPHPQ